MIEHHVKGKDQKTLSKQLGAHLTTVVHIIQKFKVYRIVESP